MQLPSSIKNFGFFPFVIPAVFAVGLGAGYLTRPRPVPSVPAAVVDEVSSPSIAIAERSGPDPAAVAGNTEPVSPGTAEDVFEALGGILYSERAFRVQKAVERLDVPQLESVLQQIDSIGRFDQFHVIPRVIDRLMDLDPAKALSWLETNAPTFREGSTTYTAAFEMACRKDPAGARRLYDAMADGDRRNAVGSIVIRYMAMKDPAAAFAFLKTFPNGAARDALALGYVNGLAASDPASAISQALKWREGATREATLTKAFLILARAGQGQALAALDQIKIVSERGELLSRLAARARENEAPALAAYYQAAVRDHPELAESFEGVDGLADAFARTDPAKAMEWAESLPGSQRSEALSTALSVWGWKEPLAAIDWSEKNARTPDERRDQVDIIYRGWLKTDLPKARAWAESLPDPAERQHHMGLIVSAYATKGQHPEALELLQQLPAGQQSELAIGVTGRLAAEDPPLASRWLGQIEADEKSASLYGRVAAEWAEKDFKAAAEWMGSLPGGPCRDQAVSSYSTKVARVEPAAGIEWAATVSNESIRKKLVDRLWFSWQARDSESAVRWLEQTTILPAEGKAALRSFAP